MPADKLRRELRRRLRRERRALSRGEQLDHARAVLRLVAASPLLRHAQRIATYVATDGELDPAPLIERLFRLHKLVALPVVQANGRMRFRRYRPNATLAKNRFGIGEPNATIAALDPTTFDVVFAPLVAFDSRGNRLGRGGGFYDATFGTRGPVPLLIGLAHELQHVDTLPAELWDVSLDAVITEHRAYAFTLRGQRVTGH